MGEHKEDRSEEQEDGLHFSGHFIVGKIESIVSQKRDMQASRSTRLASKFSRSFAERCPILSLGLDSQPYRKFPVILKTSAEFSPLDFTPDREWQQRRARMQPGGPTLGQDLPYDSARFDSCERLVQTLRPKGQAIVIDPHAMQDRRV